MRKPCAVYLLTLALCVAASPARAQTATPDAGPSWERLKGLAPSMGIHVKARNSTGNCAFKSTSDTELICISTNGATQTYSRADIKVVQIRHRGRSTLAGLALGAGIGAAVGAPLGRSGSFVGHGAAAVIVALPGALIGMLVGATTDFTHSTVYRAH